MDNIIVTWPDGLKVVYFYKALSGRGDLISGDNMKILDLFRKLGVLRYGAKADTYTSAKNMPTELFMEEVYDAKKDLLKKADLKPPTCPQRKRE